MHPRNKLRLMAGITIDPLLEKKDVYTTDTTGKKNPYPGQCDGTTDKKCKGNSTKSKQNRIYGLAGLDSNLYGTDTAGDAGGIGESEDSITEMEGPSSKDETTPTASENFNDGDVVLYDNGVHVVVLSDPQSDMLGIIAAGLKDASADEKNRAVEMVKPDKCRRPTEEEIDVMQLSPAELKSIDDDMSVEFSAESEEKDEEVVESTHNYKGHQISHEDTDSDPINVVGQGEKQWANSLDSKEVRNKHTLQVNNRDEQSANEEHEKVKVPAAIKKALKDAIKAFETDAGKQGNGHTARENAQMFLDTAEAFKTLLGHIEKGTLFDLKKAQIFATTLMGPMFHKIPDNVWDFIVNGGQKRSLKDYMIKVGDKK